MIPRFITRFWAGSQMPLEYVEYGRQWQALNPTWTLIDFTEDTLPPLRNQVVIDDLYRRDGGRRGVELFVQMADVIGYELVHMYGGVYVNVDLQPTKPLGDLIERYQLENTAFAPFEDDRFVVGNFMGGVDNDPFWRRVVDALPGRYFANPTEEMNQTTGPRLLTDVYEQNLRDNLHPFRALPVRTYNAVHWSQIEAGGDASHRVADLSADGDVYGIHHWGHKKVGRTNYVETATQVKEG